MVGHCTVVVESLVWVLGGKWLDVEKCKFVVIFKYSYMIGLVSKIYCHTVREGVLTQSLKKTLTRQPFEEWTHQQTAFSKHIGPNPVDLWEGCLWFCPEWLYQRVCCMCVEPLLGKTLVKVPCRSKTWMHTANVDFHTERWLGLLLRIAY